MGMRAPSRRQHRLLAVRDEEPVNGGSGNAPCVLPQKQVQVRTGRARLQMPWLDGFTSCLFAPPPWLRLEAGFVVAVEADPHARGRRRTTSRGPTRRRRLPAGAP
jgi:hypothetical protein